MVSFALRTLNIAAYLKRINYTGSLAPTAEALRALQLAHLRTVPFENLSIQAGEPIELDDSALFRKIVENRRGGFCYEANGLFAALLRRLGFNVAMLSAGVAKPPAGVNEQNPLLPDLSQFEFGPDFDHMALMVTPPESEARRWLVDVGFGDSFLEPLLLDERGDQVQGPDIFRILEGDTHLLLIKCHQAETWKPQYRFTLQPRTYAEYEEMCRYHQTSPESHFTKGRICSRATEDGRITLSEMRLITTQGQLRHERILMTQDEYDRVLRDQFGIVMKT
jgi:N-hydroxyarylamine O-acetyltransferase